MDLIERAKDLTIDTVKWLKTHRRKAKLFDSPLYPTLNVLFRPSTGIYM